MAILTVSGNQVEVRIRKQSKKAYYDEYVRLEKREHPSATTCNQFIAPEPDTTYSIEVTLKKGYVFGECKEVVASLFLDGNLRRVAARSIYRPQDHEGGT